MTERAKLITTIRSNQEIFNRHSVAFLEDHPNVLTLYIQAVELASAFPAELFHGNIQSASDFITVMLEDASFTHSHVDRCLEHTGYFGGVTQTEYDIYKEKAYSTGEKLSQTMLDIMCLANGGNTNITSAANKNPSAMTSCMQNLGQCVLKMRDGVSEQRKALICIEGSLERLGANEIMIEEVRRIKSELADQMVGFEGAHQNCITFRFDLAAP